LKSKAARKAVLGGGGQRYHLGLLESAPSLFTKIFHSVNTKTRNDSTIDEILLFFISTSLAC